MDQKYRIRMFGICEEITGKQEIELSIEGGLSSDELLSSLRQEYPDLGKINSLALAVNQQYVQASIYLNPGDEIALIPPVSGG